MTWVRKGKGKGEVQQEGEMSNVQTGGECSSFEQMEKAQPHKSHQLCGSLEHFRKVNEFRPLSNLETSNKWSLLARDEDETYDYPEHDVPPGLLGFKTVHKSIKPKMPRVKKWLPKSDEKDSKYVCWSSDQGGAATWHCLHADGFKSSGMCGKKTDEIEIKPFELSNIEELFEIFNIETNGQTENDPHGDFIDFTVDSGAADTVADREIAPNTPVVPSHGSRNGVKYVAAAGKVISNEGEKHVQTQTAEGHLCGIKIQVAQVNKALLSVSKICDVGHEVIFTKDGGRIVHQVTGQVVHFRRVDGVYRLRVKVVKGSGSGFTRPEQ